MRHADAICVGYAEETWPQLLRDFAAGQMRRRYDQGHDFELDQPAVCAPRPARRAALPDASGVRGDARLRARLRVLRGADRLGPQAVPEAGRAMWSRTSGGSAQRRIIFIDLNLISDRAYATELFDGAGPAEACAGSASSTSLIGRDRELMAADGASGCRGLLIGLETHLDGQPARHPQALQRPRRSMRTLIADLHALGIAMQGCFVFGYDHDDLGRLRPRPWSSRSTLASTCRASRSSPRSRARRCTRGSTREGRILTTNWELYDGQHVVFQPQADERRRSCRPATSGPGARSIATARSSGGWPQRAHNCRSPLMANLGYRYYAHHLDTHYNCDWPIGSSSERRGRGCASTLVHPAIGRRAGATTCAPGRWSRCRLRLLAALTPQGRRDHASTTTAWSRSRSTQPTDLVAIPVETYTAKRAYQIASEYRRRGVPVVMGGFHATLVPDEVARVRRGRGGRRGRGRLAAGDRRRAHGTLLKPIYRVQQPARPRLRCATTARSSAASATCRSG